MSFIEEHLESATATKAIKQVDLKEDFPIYIIQTKDCPLCDMPGHHINSMYIRHWAGETWIAPCEFLQGWFVLEHFEHVLENAEKSWPLQDQEESDALEQGKNAAVPEDMLPDEPVRLGQ